MNQTFLRNMRNRFAGLVSDALITEMATFTGDISKWSNRIMDQVLIQYVLKGLAAGALGQAYRVCAALLKLYPAHDCVEAWLFVENAGELQVIMTVRDPKEDLLYAGLYCGTGSAPMLVNGFGADQPSDVMDLYPAVTAKALADQVSWNAGSPIKRIILRVMSRELGLSKQEVAEKYLSRMQFAGCASQMTPRGFEGARLFYIRLTPEEAARIPLTHGNTWVAVKDLLQPTSKMLAHQRPRLEAMVNHMTSGQITIM